MIVWHVLQKHGEGSWCGKFHTQATIKLEVLTEVRVKADVFTKPQPFIRVNECVSF